MTTMKPTLKLLKPSMNKKPDLKLTYTDLLLKKLDLKRKLTTLTNVSELNPLLPKPPQTNYQETNNFGTKPKPSAEPSITNITMPLKPEDKNSNWSQN